MQEYRGDLGAALTDVVGMDAFLADFDLYFAKLFDGLRHDSGDPLAWGEKALAHYARLRIDPHTKRLVFSDGLDLEAAFGIYRHPVQQAWDIAAIQGSLAFGPLSAGLRHRRCRRSLCRARTPDPAWTSPRAGLVRGAGRLHRTA